MRRVPIAFVACLALLYEFPVVRRNRRTRFSGERKLNNLVTVLVDVADVSKDANFTLTRPTAGWIFVSASIKGQGSVTIALGKEAPGDTLVDHVAKGPDVEEAMRFVDAGEHLLHVKCAPGTTVERLVVKAIPDLMHCGLGFNSAIKSYGLYDMDFLKQDILPNVTTLVVPSNIELPPAVIDGWHGQGKRFIAEVGVNDQGKSADEHVEYWTGFLQKAPFLDGILINEFIVNRPSAPPGVPVSPRTERRREEEQARHRVYEEAFRRMHADERWRDKRVFAYVGGSGKKLNQEMIGPTFVRTLIECDDRIALERYLFEVSSEEKSREALRTFAEGIADWEAKQPGAKRHMVIAFGLFSMPPGGINKQPNVDYHVWMDRQMNLVASHPALAGIAGLEWWTSVLADEETVRFVGKLYRHYAIEGRTDMLTHDPLFLPHIQNADFEKGTDGWTLHAAEEGAIEARSFPRYGRIEGRYMGLGRPADPEHIGDTFLWMKRSDQGPNSFSQTIEQLEPGRLYSMKMLSCDYQDLVHPQKKTQEEAQPFLGRVELEGVDLCQDKSFAEIYPSSPEPPIPVWITYHWRVFRARGKTARLTVSDWPSKEPGGPCGQEQAFNFLEIQPYHE